jgi:hypothetical protein
MEQLNGKMPQTPGFFGGGGFNDIIADKCGKPPTQPAFLCLHHGSLPLKFW